MTAADVADVRAMNALRRLVSALRSSGATGKFLGMSIAQRFALRAIGQHPGLTMSELAAATLTTRSAVSEVVVKLVRHHFVRRDVDLLDNRRKRLALTPEGEAVFRSLDQTVPERLALGLASMSYRDRERLATSLEQWIDAAALGDVSPAMFGEPPLRAVARLK